MYKQKTHIIGKAFGPNIMRECIICHDLFVMTCEDYLFNNCGMKVWNNDPDNPIKNDEGWVCEECAEEIIRIKNL